MIPFPSPPPDPDAPDPHSFFKTSLNVPSAPSFRHRTNLGHSDVLHGDQISVLGILAHLTQPGESDAPSNTGAPEGRGKEGQEPGVLENRVKRKEELENLQFSDRMEGGGCCCDARRSGRAPPSAAAAMLLFSGSGISQSRRPAGSTYLQALKTDVFQRKCCAGATFYASIICHLGSELLIPYCLRRTDLIFLFLSFSPGEMQPEFYLLELYLACISG